MTPGTSKPQVDQHTVQSGVSTKVASPVRTHRILLRVGVATAIGMFALLVALHFANVIPMHLVPRILTAPFRPPQPADTANAVKYERRQFTFAYPGNWSIDSMDPHHDPDSFLILEAPRRGQVRLQIIDVSIDPESSVEQVAARFELPGLRLKGRSEFHNWGQLAGHGLNLSGERFGAPFQVRIFTHSGETRSLIVWEYWWDGADSINTAGYRLIEESFRFTTADGSQSSLPAVSSDESFARMAEPLQNNLVPHKTTDKKTATTDS